MPLQIEYFEGGVRRSWKPFPRQEKFLSLPWEVFEAFYGGAVGGGKSELLVLIPILMGWHKNKNFRGIIFRRTMPELKESLIPRSEEIYKAEGGIYNATDHIWKFPSGASIKFSYLESMADARSHDTAEFHYAAFDELTHFEEGEYTYIVGSRVRSTIPELPACVRCASNPGNIGHAWVRKLFVEPDRDGFGDTIIYDELTRTYRAFVRARLTDNPYLMKNDPNYINRLRRLPPAEYKAKVEGDWWVFAGQVFSEFRTDHLIGEPAHALHVIDPFRIPGFWPRVLAIDWGGINPDLKAKTIAGWYAIAPGRQAFKYREYTSKDKIAIWGADVARLSAGEPIRRVVLDPSAWASRGEKHTLMEQFVQASQFRSVEKATNDRIAGKQLLHEFLRWAPRPARYVPPEGYDEDVANRIFRIYGTKGLRDYREMFQPERPEGNLPKLFIFRHCSETIDIIPKCTYNDPGKAGKNPEDVREFDGDDAYDETRYGVNAIEDLLGSPDAELEKLVAEGRIVDNLARTGDQTSYYRSMEKFEKDNKSVDQPTRIYHSPRFNRGRPGRR
jgi:hypothetical protein